MQYEWTKLPLYEEWDYEYNAAIASQSIDFHIYYSDRARRWSFDMEYANGAPILQGTALVPLSPMMENGIEGVSGFLWLEPISAEINEALLHPDMLHKYYNLYYIHWSEEEV